MEPALACKDSLTKIRADKMEAALKRFKWGRGPWVHLIGDYSPFQSPRLSNPSSIHPRKLMKVLSCPAVAASLSNAAFLNPGPHLLSSNNVKKAS